MVAGSSDSVLTPADRAFLAEARIATLATVAADGRPRLVPICFVVDDAGVIWSPLDEKPKSVAEVRSLARVRDILARPQVTLLVQRWSEDWAELAWLRLDGRAAVVDAPPDVVVTALRRRYPQYAGHDLEHRPALRIVIERVARWAATDRAATDRAATGRAATGRAATGDRDRDRRPRPAPGARDRRPRPD